MTNPVCTEPNMKPDAWVKKYATLIPSGPILDLACGSGRHGRYFLDLGYPVTFIDKDISGVVDLSTHKNAVLITYDLENHDLEKNAPWPFQTEQFSGIVVIHYLHRPLFSHLKTTVKPGGIIIYKTFSSGNGQFGRPRNPNFLLQENELRTVFDNQFRELAFFQGLERDPKRIVQSICVERII